MTTFVFPLYIKTKQPYFRRFRSISQIAGVLNIGPHFSIAHFSLCLLDYYGLSHIKISVDYAIKHTLLTDLGYHILISLKHLLTSDLSGMVEWYFSRARKHWPLFEASKLLFRRIYPKFLKYHDESRHICHVISNLQGRTRGQMGLYTNSLKRVTFSRARCRNELGQL